MERTRFASFNEFFETMTRGNEVILEYNCKAYSVTPAWQENSICGFHIGECYGNFVICANESELKEYIIDGKRFIDIFDCMSVVDSVL